STGYAALILCDFKVLVVKPDTQFSAELHFFEIGTGKITFFDKLITGTAEKHSPEIQVLKGILLKQGTDIHEKSLGDEKVQFNGAEGIPRHQFTVILSVQVTPQHRQP